VAVRDALGVVALARDFIRIQVLDHGLVLSSLLSADVGRDVIAATKHVLAQDSGLFTYKPGSLVLLTLGSG